MVNFLIKINDFINAVQYPCGYAGYEQFQFDLLRYGDKRSNAINAYLLDKAGDPAD